MTFAAARGTSAGQSFLLLDDRPQARQAGAALDPHVRFEPMRSLSVKLLMLVAGDRQEERPAASGSQRRLPFWVALHSESPADDRPEARRVA